MTAENPVQLAVEAMKGANKREATLLPLLKVAFKLPPDIANRLIDMRIASVDYLLQEEMPVPPNRRLSGHQRWIAIIAASRDPYRADLASVQREILDEIGQDPNILTEDDVLTAVMDGRVTLVRRLYLPSGLS